MAYKYTLLHHFNLRGGEREREDYLFIHFMCYTITKYSAAKYSKTLIPNPSNLKGNATFPKTLVPTLSPRERSHQKFMIKCDPNHHASGY